jgi:hypothetical protein
MRDSLPVDALPVLEAAAAVTVTVLMMVDGALGTENQDPPKKKSDLYEYSQRSPVHSCH